MSDEPKAIVPLESQDEALAYHDPNGLAVQFHELPDGSGLLTFSDEFTAELDWRIGDEILLSPEEANTGLFLRNLTAEQRKKEA